MTRGTAGPAGEVDVSAVRRGVVTGWLVGDDGPVHTGSALARLHPEVSE